MKVDKIIKKIQKVDVNISEITLLSVEEYEKYIDNIPKYDEWWWLRSPGNDSYYAAVIDGDGSVCYGGDGVGDDDDAVRPIIILQSNNFQIKDNFILAGHIWTLIDNDKAICNDGIGNTYFRRNWQASDANDYEVSDIKKWLENWAKDNGIEIQKSINN